MSSEATRKLEEKLKFYKLQRNNLLTRNNKAEDLKKKLKTAETHSEKKKIQATLRMLDEIEDREVDRTMRGGEDAVPPLT